MVEVLWLRRSFQPFGSSPPYPKSQGIFSFFFVEPDFLLSYGYKLTYADSLDEMGDMLDHIIFLPLTLPPKASR